MNYISKITKRSMSDPINNDRSSSSSSSSYYTLDRRAFSTSSQQPPKRLLSSMDFISNGAAHNYRNTISMDMTDMKNIHGGSSSSSSSSSDVDSNIINGNDGISQYRSIPLCGNEIYKRSHNRLSSLSSYNNNNNNNNNNAAVDNDYGYESSLLLSSKKKKNNNNNSNVDLSSPSSSSSSSVGAFHNRNKNHNDNADDDSIVVMNSNMNATPKNAALLLDNIKTTTTTTTKKKETIQSSYNNGVGIGVGTAGARGGVGDGILFEYQKLLPKWKGPLSGFGHYWINPEISLFVIKDQIEHILLSMVNNKRIDYNIDENNQCIHGRAFGRRESCTFVIALFILQSHPKDNSYTESTVKPMVEIRRMGGDGFVFEEFSSSFIKQMNQRQIILPNRCYGANDDNSEDMEGNNSQSINFGWNINMNTDMDIEDIDMMDMDMSLTSLDIDLSDLGSLTMEPCQNSSDRSEESDDSDLLKTDKEEEIRDWFNSIIDRNTYEDYVRFCTVQLLKALENRDRNSHLNNNNNNNDNDDDEDSIDIYLVIIAKSSQRCIADELLTLITSDFYDVFCIRNIVNIVNHLLKIPMIQHRYIYRNLSQIKQKIQQVKNQWSDKCELRISSNYSIEFDRSQQIVQSCNDCLNTIATLP